MKPHTKSDTVRSGECEGHGKFGKPYPLGVRSWPALVLDYAQFFM